VNRSLAAIAAVSALCATVALSCGPNAADPKPSAPGTAAPSQPNAAPDAAQEPPTVVFLGDSLTAGLGLGEDEAFPALVGSALAERGLAVRVVNAGVSGDTTAGGLARLDWLLTQKPAVVFVALGANDGLRAQPLPAIERALAEIVERARAAGAVVALGGMRMPPNYGPEYTRDFEAIYRRLASERQLPFLPFLLEGVAAVPALNQADGIHPTAEGQRRIAALVLPVIEPLVREAIAKANQVPPAAAAAASSDRQ
jgi:acyl-CoA thioesterase-1